MTFHTSHSLASQQIGVSNSEAYSALKCWRAWWYGHHPDVKLAPNSFGIARTRGLAGHKALELFYLALKEEAKYDDAAQLGLDHLQSEAELAMMLMDSDKLEMLVYLKKIMNLYFEHYKSDVENWEILDVESFHLMEWENEHSVYLPMRLDLVIYQRAGKFKGETSPVDHKFINDFWNIWKFRLNSQLPLYIRTLRASRFAGKNDPVVKRSIVNMVRTRKMADPYPSELFRRAFIDADPTVIENVFKNHLKTALEVARLKAMPAREAFQETSASWGGQDCSFCDFKSLCATQLEGGNIDSTVAAEFQRNEYGYPTMEELKNER